MYSLLLEYNSLYTCTYIDRQPRDSKQKYFKKIEKNYLTIL